MSLLLEPVVGGSATDLDGVLSPPLDKGRTGYLGGQKGIAGGGDGGQREERGFLPSLSGVSFKVAGSDEASSDSSSIGAPDDSDEEETGSGGDEDEVQSTLSLDSLEHSLPTKKGLSSYYAGRSKSFGNLSDVKSVNDMQKADNAFNKKRRNILAYKLSYWSSSSSSCSSPSKRRMMIKDNRSSFYGHRNPISMPLLPVHEHDDDNNEEEEEEEEEDDDDDDDYKDDMDNRGGSTTDLRRSELHLGLTDESRFCI